MIFRHPHHLSEGEFSLIEQLKWLSAGILLIIASISVIGGLLALSREKSAGRFEASKVENPIN